MRERRSHRRYTIQLSLDYTVVYRGGVIRTGHGKTVNVSIHGVLFESDAALLVGEQIELSIDWPAGLALHATGRIVRADGNRIAVKIDHYRFRWVGSHF